MSSKEAQIKRLASEKSLFVTCWKQLEIEPGSDLIAVSKAYRRLSLLVHPDKAPPELATEAHIAFTALTEAFQQALKVAKDPRLSGSDCSARGNESCSGDGPCSSSASHVSAQEKSHFPGFASGWWKDKKSWEVEELLRRFEAEMAEEAEAAAAALERRKEERALRRKEREEEITCEQKAWLENVQANAEMRRASWQSFMTKGGPSHWPIPLLSFPWGCRLWAPCLPGTALTASLVEPFPLPSARFVPSSLHLGPRAPQGSQPRGGGLAGRPRRRSGRPPSLGHPPAPPSLVLPPARDSTPHEGPQPPPARREAQRGLSAPRKVGMLRLGCGADSDCTPLSPGLRA
mmetsp:Transcript_7213/g.17306  ORF Transcript_7213/g.17306 Transcript_7213/m.17306 type:complete len:346 (+) Transcript_7213:167-1204(+)